MMRHREMMTRLEEIMRALSRDDRQSLLAFAEFLSARAPRRTEIAAPVVPMSRPEGETVVAAIKRLSAQYPMLDKAKLLDAASRLMGEHVLRRRKADEVITELQKVFESHYQDLMQGEQSVS
jgi:hypothetical protein